MGQHLYRHFDKEGQLLYIGISLSTIKRLSQHAAGSIWFDQIAKVTIEHFETREEVLKAEHVAISTENPLHNINKRKPLHIRETQELQEDSEEELICRYVRFNPMYEMHEIYNILPIGRPAIKKYMESGELQYIEIHSGTKTIKRYITGWQLINFIEYLEQKQEKVQKHA
jgi:predicted GIY-YIG superfamily endonuclease